MKTFKHQSNRPAFGNKQSLMAASVCSVALVLGSAAAIAQSTIVAGNVPYLSLADRPPSLASERVIVEDFEDGVIDPRLVFNLGGSIIGPGGLTDSVDSDDGVIDGSGTNGRSFFRNATTIDVSFLTQPKVAGLVWTDGGPSVEVTVQAFTPDGTLFGTSGPHVLGDANNAGGTAEDRYFGFRREGGIGRIRVSHTGGGMEIDHVQFSGTAEPLIMGTLEDGNLAVLLRAPDSELPATPQQSFALTAEVRPHAVAFLNDRILYQDFGPPRVLLADPNTVFADIIDLTGRSNGNGSLAVDPTHRYALSIGESNDANPTGEAVVIDFGVSPPVVSPIAGGLRVLSFVTEAIDFAPDRRAFVCHTQGVSVLSPPYQSIDFTMAFPAVVQSPSMCRLTRDGSRLFVTRVLSETTAAPNGVRTTAAPFSAASMFILMPAPADVQGLGPMAVSPDGSALMVGQQFLFPPNFVGVRARAFILRAPFNGQTSYAELTLPANTTGLNCTDSGMPIQCPGFEAIEVSRDGTLAVLGGNSGAAVSGAGDRVPAVFIRHPFNNQARSALAVQIGPPGSEGRGAGGLAFKTLPESVFRNGFE